MNKNTYHTKMQKQIEKLRDQKEEIRSYQSKLNDEQRETMHKHLATWSEREKQVTDQWQALQEATEDTWHDVRRSLEQRVSDLRQIAYEAGKFIEEATHQSLGWPEGLAADRPEGSEGWAEGLGSKEKDSEGWAEGQGTRVDDSQGWSEGYEKARTASTAK